jgi:carboxyl-terminal processing protease
MKVSLFALVCMSALSQSLMAQAPAEAPQQAVPSATPVLSGPQSPEISPATKADVETKISELLGDRAYVPTVDFTQWPNFLKGEQPKLDAAKTEDEFTRDINEALTKFSASHIYLASPKASDARRTQSMVGIGISQQTAQDGTVTVMHLVPGAPAEMAGLVPGDVILDVDGRKAEGIKGIAGPEGSQVILTVRHLNGKTEDVTITRAKFSTIRPEELTELNKTTAKLTIYTFDWTYDRDRVEDLMQKAQKYKNLILDLRDNGGGAVVNLQHLLGFFLSPDTSIGTFVKKELVNNYVLDTGGKPSDVVKIASWSRTKDRWDSQQIRPLHTPSDERFHGHVAVLINKFSGSASEIAAAALHDLDNAQLVGQKSAGAVLVSVIVPASHDFNLQYPIMDYVTIKGLRLEGNGLTPTVQVDGTPAKFNAPDIAVEKAEELLAQSKNHEDRG